MRMRRLGALLLCIAVPALTGARVEAQEAGQAQAVQTEAELRSQIAQDPDAPANYLALALVYLEQGRLDDAQMMMSNALALTRRMAANQPRSTSNDPVDPSQPVRIGGDIREPFKTHDVKAVYPAIAEAAGVSGIVIIEALIDRQGNVADTKVLRSIQLLDQAAVDAVSQWQFEPTTINGQAVEVLMTVTVNFSAGTNR